MLWETLTETETETGTAPRPTTTDRDRGSRDDGCYGGGEPQVWAHKVPHCTSAHGLHGERQKIAHVDCDEKRVIPAV